MSNGTILLTGATGLVGFRVLEKLLEGGSHVRLAVRSESKFSALRQALETARKDTKGIEHVIVPDMTQEGAFIEAIKGISYVIHIASPLPVPSDDLEATIVKPAVAVTTGLLNTLVQTTERSVKKVVITSSITAVSPPETRPFDADNIEPDPKGPWTNGFLAYEASKKRAYNATRRIIAEDKPYFDIINIMPTFVVGPNGYAESRKEYMAGSNSFALAPLLGIKLESGTPGSACHVDDVATAHVAALRPSIAGHHNYGVSSGGKNGVEWNSAIEIVKEKLPEAVGPHCFPLRGSVATVKSPMDGWDASKTERELGIKFKDFGTMVVDLAKAYFEAKA